ncbi:MAG: hypothetical protein AN483_06085 [Aphanizomenon flos-aquae MDT14a]|jgi:hypothetical protein|nr:MAG: hypothetical protein AN483_06085 [Aphanizomenon flos-aquae MDT14a]
MQKLSILICSSDKYKSLWNLNFDFLEKYWSDCPYPVYLGTDSLLSERSKTLVNRKGQYLSWSSCLLEWINQIDTEYVLLTLDDFIIRKKINQLQIENCLEFIIRKNIDSLRLVRRPKPFYPENENSLFGRYDMMMPYLASLQASIWKKSSLLSLIKEGESIWEFENSGSSRAREQGGLSFYGVYETVFDYGEHIIDGGKLLRTSTYNLPIDKYKLDFTPNSFPSEINILLKRLRHFCIHNTPTYLRLKLINFLYSKYKSNTVEQKTIASHNKEM